MWDNVPLLCSAVTSVIAQSRFTQVVVLSSVVAFHGIFQRNVDRQWARDSLERPVLGMTPQYVLLDSFD